MYLKYLNVPKKVSSECVIYNTLILPPHSYLYIQWWTLWVISVSHFLFFPLHYTVCSRLGFSHIVFSSAQKDTNWRWSVPFMHKYQCSRWLVFVVSLPSYTHFNLLFSELLVSSMFAVVMFVAAILFEIWWRCKLGNQTLIHGSNITPQTWSYIWRGAHELWPTAR